MAKRPRPNERPPLRSVPMVAGRVPPHDLDAEAAVLSAVMISAVAFEEARALLSVESFFSDANGRIFSAALEVSAEGRSVDTVSIASKLRDLGQLKAVGGIGYISQIIDATPAVNHVADHAKIVLTKWRARSFIAFCHSGIAEAFEADPILLVEAHRQALEPLLTGTSTAPSLAAQVRNLGAEGPPISTNVAHLDNACRGGIRAGTLTVLAGAPGAGKTTLAVQIAHDAALRGIPVAILAADEAGRGLIVRIGQLVGLNRHDLERGDEMAKDFLAQQCEGDLATLDLRDAALHGVTVEGAASELGRRAAGRAGLLIVDSIQKLTVLGSGDAETPRARVDAVMKALLAVSRRHSLAVIATSEVSRAFYRGGSDAEPNPLAAGKDSGSVEYDADTVVVLSSIPDGGGDVSIVVPKNRQGSQGSDVTWRMRIDHDRARMSSIETVKPTPKGDTTAARVAKEEAAIGRVKQNVIQSILRSREPITTVRDLVRIVGGHRPHVEAAVARLMSDGTIERVRDAGRKQGVRIMVASTTDPHRSPTDPQTDPQADGTAATDPQNHSPPQSTELMGSGVGVRSANGVGDHIQPITDPQTPTDPQPDPGLNGGAS